MVENPPNLFYVLDISRTFYLVDCPWVINDKIKCLDLLLHNKVIDEKVYNRL